MNDPGLGPDAVERMLRGESARRPALAALLAAASAPPARDPDGEEAAVAAFVEARSRPYRRRISALVGLKTAVVGVVLLLAGGVAVAATGQHSGGPARTRHSGRTGAPAERGRTTARSGSSPSPRPATSRPTPEAAPAERPSSKVRTPHPAESPETHTPAVRNGTGVPSVAPRRLTTTNPTETITPGSVAGVLGGCDAERRPDA